MMHRIKKGDKIVIFIIRRENGESISDIKRFILDLSNPDRKSGLDGKFRVKNKMTFHNKINKSSMILFKFDNLIIGTAEVVKTDDGFPHKICDEDRRGWLYYYDNYGNSLTREDEFDAYYYKLKNVKLIQPINYYDIVGDKEAILISDGKGIKSPYEGAIVRDADKFNKYLNRKGTMVPFIGELDSSIPYCLLREIDFYNLENIHTAFLKNYLDLDNIYGFKDKALNKFLNMIQIKYNNMDNFSNKIDNLDFSDEFF